MHWKKTSATTIGAYRLDTQLVPLGGSNLHFANERQSKRAAHHVNAGMTAKGELHGRTISGAAVDGQSVELRMESEILYGA